ncbi:Rv2578c family radical SAM protein [Luteimicrobium subarcticum]|uniref:DNA repair photolyase n=1 Tax=Luteimicrobium subarcticum TaxID=620910 RepID=A0A2M8W414_9MICO|nr:Rv2578c family radical SAM protein [Luteimicrobium subarcticum]PJI85639.1 DNA repair photolyase [Luteimicrobium subarcticum]
MRWDGQTLGADDGALPGLRRAGFVRTVRTPEFAGTTFHEVTCRSALSHVPAASHVPFRWTVNPIRGCGHRCTFCFARGTHRYLDLNTGEDFDRQLVVKVNLVEVLRAELARPSWQREHVALGTNTDPYQRAEGRYRLMPGVIDALASSGTPFSILTKGTLLRRDLPALQDAAEQVDVGVGVSMTTLDEELHLAVEPGTPSPRARLDLVRAVVDAGLRCHVMLAPVLPWLTDSTAHLDAMLREVAAAGASRVTVLPLHLRSGAREWYLEWLAGYRPDLVDGYRRVYGDRAYASRDYQRWLADRAAPLVRKHGLDQGEEPGRRWGVRERPAGGEAVHDQPGERQPALF